MLKILYRWFHRLISKSYQRGEYSSGVWQERVRDMALVLCKGKEGNILEVGCGEGLFLAKLDLDDRGRKIYGVDNWNEILKKAYKRLRDGNIENVRLYQADASLLPFTDSFFDTVLCINVIFNLESGAIVEKVLKEIARVCRKGGYVIFDFRNKRNPFLNLKYRFAPYYDCTVKGLPLKTYNLEEMQIFLDRAGLKIRKQINVGFPKWVPPIIILETEKE